MDGVRFAFSLPGFSYWASCIAFVYFARDAGADWMKTISAAVTNWSSSKVLLVTVDEHSYIPWLLAATTLISSLCLLPTAILISHHMDGSLWTKLLLSPTMTYVVLVAIKRGEGLPSKNRQAFLAGVCLAPFVGNLVCTAAAWFTPITLSPPAMMCMAMITPLFYGLHLLDRAMSASATAMLALAFFTEPLFARMAPNASVLIASFGSFALIATFRKLRNIP